MALVGRVAIVEGEVHTYTIHWHREEAHTYLGLYVKSPSVLIVGIYLRVRLHARVHSAQFYPDVRLEHAFSAKSPPRGYAEGYLVDRVLLVGVEALGTAQL